MFRAVIFDMDGLLIDSEPLWVRAEIEVFGEVGVVLGEEDCAKTKGLRVDDVIAYWYARHPWETRAPKDVEERLVTRVAELVAAEGVALRGVEHAIAVAKQDGRKLALASSSPSQIIHAALGRLGIAEAFAVVQSAETLPLGKPHPGIFIETANRLGVAAVECVVLEDSLTGVLAAKSARMACIAVPFDHPSQEPRFVIADSIVGSLTDVTPELLAKIDAAR